MLYNSKTVRVSNDNMRIFEKCMNIASNKTKFDTIRGETLPYDVKRQNKSQHPCRTDSSAYGKGLTCKGLTSAFFLFRVITVGDEMICFWVDLAL